VPAFFSLSRRALVTGFEPFGGDPINPSELIARRLDGREIGGYRVVGRALPVDAQALPDALAAALAAAGEVDAIIGTGLAAGRTALALERTAVNVLDFDQPDDTGTLLRGKAIHENGAAAYFTNLPLARILAAWREAGIPGYVSDSAGTYICNQLFYEVLALNERSIPIGFVHLPCSVELAIARGPAKTPSLSLDLMRRGIETLIESL
jgi:pyroglutamyl-peptidase